MKAEGGPQGALRRSRSRTPQADLQDTLVILASCGAYGDETWWAFVKEKSVYYRAFEVHRHCLDATPRASAYHLTLNEPIRTGQATRLPVLADTKVFRCSGLELARVLRSELSRRSPRQRNSEALSDVAASTRRRLGIVAPTG